MQEDGEADREEDRVQQHRLVRQVGILDEDHREHDRRQSARPEPAEERDGRAPRAGSEHRQDDGEHADDGQAEERIHDDLDGEVVERGHEHDGAEEDERDRTEQAARLLEEVAHLAPDLAAQPAEDGPADERGDEPAAVHPDRQPVGERGPGDRDDLNPDRIDEAARDTHPDHGCGREPRDHAADASIPDLLEHELERGAVSDRARFRLGDRDRDQEQRHADAVVEPALDVEPLANP